MIQEKQKIKIVIGINDFIIGGAQKLIADLLLRFDHDTFEFHLITLMQFDDKENFFDLVSDKVKIHRLKFKGFIDLSSWRKLFKLLRGIKPEIVWSHLFFSNTIFRVLSIFLKYKCIINEHNTYIWKNFFQKLTDRFLAKYTYKIVAVSQTVADFTSRQEKISKDKFQVIYNGVDLEKIRKEIKELPPKEVLKGELGFSSNDKILLNVSRLTYQKNHKLLIDGFYLFHKLHSEYKLAIVGDGSLMSLLKKQVSDLGITDSVRFFGHRSDVYNFYKISDAFVSTSFIEGLSLAYLEAMACRLPVLATRTAGTDEIIVDKRNGIFINKIEEQEVSNSLEDMVLFLAEKKDHSDDLIEKFDINNISKDYVNLFESSIH